MGLTEKCSVAQGAVSIGGLSAGGGVNVQVNHPTVGIVTGGLEKKFV